MNEAIAIRLFNPATSPCSHCYAAMADHQSHADGGQRLEAGVQAREAQQRSKPTHGAALSDISRQVDWYGEKLSPEDRETFCPV